jgi:FSR family fosmidomycin resistance protein-like MFS transporter
MDSDKTVLFILGAAHSLNHSLFLVLPPLLSNVSDGLNASFQTLGAISSVSFLIYGVGALVGGPLSDRLGGVKVSMLSMGLSGASTLFFIISQELTVFAVGMFLIALWASFYHPTSNSLISRLFPKNTGRAMGIHGAAASVGQMFTPTVAYILGTIVGWRFAFIFFGVLSIVTALIMRMIPEGGQSVGESTPIMSFIRAPNIWLLILFNIAIGLFSRGVELFFPTFLSVDRGFSGQLAAVANSLILLLGVGGQLAGGFAADRYGSSSILIAASLGSAAGVFALLLLPLRTIGVVLFIISYGIAYFSHQPAMTALMGFISPRDLVGAAYGVMFFCTFGLGSFSTMVSGYLADSFGLETAFWFMAVATLPALIASLAIYKRVRK